ncbi:hypothetical protein EYD00_07305 [Agrobacterium sp. 33MFTa1.1]|uniref:hypothetical protein n=1 Tax=Agrobacterium sp. 33MFTa1.1 TaxID=1279031 RepID=UPI00068A876E|nr:hypothetical protein [Agrobacterium sp. 33MFTa1.1]QBJ13214.1 hypothetical protein EYD00_07305 [Agrobacterium sp. 33MFTa1.1]
MSKIRHSGLSEVDALTHEDPYVRCMARIASSDFAVRMADFVNDELNRHGNPMMLLVSLMRFQIQTHASIAANFIAAPGIPTLVDIYVDEIEREYQPHATRTRAEMRREPAL